MTDWQTIRAHANGGITSRRAAETGSSQGHRISTKYEFYLVEEALKAFPKVIDAQLYLYLDAFAPQLLARIRASVPRREGPRPAKFAASRPGRRPAGGLVSLLTTAIDEKALRLRAGLLTDNAREDGFYGYILDAGRGNKSQISRPRRRLIARTARIGLYGSVGRETLPYTRHISPISPAKYDITFGRNRTWAQEQVGPFLTRAYERAIVEIGWGKSPFQIGGGSSA